MVDAYVACLGDKRAGFAVELGIEIGGVKRALERGEIQPTRHRSYLNILAEVEGRGKRKQR